MGGPVFDGPWVLLLPFFAIAAGVEHVRDAVKGATPDAPKQTFKNRLQKKRDRFRK